MSVKERAPTGSRLSFGVALTTVSAAALVACVGAPDLALRLGGAAVLCAEVAFLAVRSFQNAGRAEAVAAQVRAVAREAVDLEAVAKAQENLEQNLNALRDLCYTHGDPQIVGDQLRFGDYAVYGTNEIVDKVQQTHGGAATIFQRAKRVSTNVKDQDGKRLVGTTLDQGPAFECVFGQGRTYRGEAKIAGVAYITIYEPIVAASEIIGAIFVAVKKADQVGADAAGALRSPLDSIGQTADRLRSVIRDRDEAMRVAAEQRCELTDKRRKQKALERVTAQTQKNVVFALSTALDRLARADLTSSIDCAFPDEYQKVKEDFASATEALRKALIAINFETRAIRAGSIEITASVDDLSRRTEQQAANLEETAASLDQITVAVRQTSGSVDEAHKLATATRRAAEASSVVMREAVGAMTEIDRSSKQIGQIIGVINEIAFQTNLLALNAGVEAARAGEGGRGFAVVAAEVRALAQRSAEAALEIKALIEASALHVQKGVNLIGTTGSALDDITGQVTGINEIINKISGSAREQAVSLNEINTAVTQMDKFTQQNAAMVEESTAASHVLSQQAETLESLVGQFQTGEAVVAKASPAGRYASRSTRIRAVS